MVILLASYLRIEERELEAGSADDISIFPTLDDQRAEVGWRRAIGEAFWETGAES